ncbi:MAG TPA: glycosyl hydrolase, partial [Ignavibacteria bacterium]|nr:glycosyl hydrolase [Ignavibacteria bacterium]
DESPLKFGLIYVGTDDGYIWITKDGGNKWERISDSLPQDYWVSRVDASNHNEGTVYASLNGYRWDNFNALVYRSTNYGKTWEQIGKDLPAEPVNVIKEDPKKPNILYVGTDHGAYISTDYGKSFTAFSKGLPAVAVHDLVVHPRDNDIVLGTHGRSIFIADVNYIQKLDESITSKDLHFFPAEKEIKFSPRWGSLNWDWNLIEPSAAEFVFYSNNEGESSIKIFTDGGIQLKELINNSDYGLNFVKYDLTIDSAVVEKYINELNESAEEEIKIKKADNGKFYIQPGTYDVEITLNGVTDIQTLVIKAADKKERGKEKKTP